MPYDPNANWTSRTNAAAKNPVYYIALEGLASKHFSTGPVRNASVTKKALLKVPDSVAQKLSQLQGRSSLNLTSLLLVDRAGEITDLVATEKASPTLPTLVNRAVTIYAGYADLDESDYAPIAVGQINGIDLAQGVVTYELSLVDLRRQQFEEIFTNAEATQSAPINTYLLSDAPVGAAAVVPADPATINPGDKLYLGPSRDAGFLGQEQKVQVLQVTAGTIYLAAPLTVKFKAGDLCRWASTVIEGNPINLIYAIWTGLFADVNFPCTLVRGAPTGCGISASDIDQTALAKERDRIMPEDRWRFEVKRPSDGSRFLEQRVFRLLGYPVMTLPGKLSFRLYRPAWPDDAGAGLPAITKSEVKHWRFRRAHELHVNRVSLGVEVDAGSGAPATTPMLEDTADQTATKETQTFEELDTGFRTALRGVRLAEKTEADILRRFKRPPPQVEVWCDLRKRALQPGEVISFTHDEVPNVTTGLRGFSGSRLEIVEREERLKAGEVRFVLQDAGFVRPAFIGATGALPDYDSASAAQREYLYIGPAGSPPGNFGDSTPAYEVI